MLARGVAVFILNEDKFKLRSYSIYWPERVAVLIPYCNKFGLLCPSMYCSFNIYIYISQEGVAVLIP